MDFDLKLVRLRFRLWHYAAHGRPHAGAAEAGVTYTFTRQTPTFMMAITQPVVVSVGAA